MYIYKPVIFYTAFSSVLPKSALETDFRYSIGVTPMISVNARLKLRRLLNPASVQMSIRGALPVFISSMAYSNRMWFRYLRKLTPNRLEKIWET